jgi:electron transfer flavoprotein alpha/beta subunit
LHAIICLKQVPDTAELPKVQPEDITGGAIKVTRVVNPWDEYAIEEALLLKEKHGGKVTAISLGPSEATEALKTAVAMGSDEAILLSDPAFGDGDAGTIGYTLAKAIAQIGEYDIILCGKESVDGNSGLTPLIIARHLGIPLLTFVIKIREVDFAGRTITVERLVEEGLEIDTSPLPALVSVTKGINEPRYPSFRGIRTAARMEIPTWGMGGIAGLDPTKASEQGASVRWTNLRKPPARAGQCEIITADSIAEQAAGLADKLLAAKVI